MGTAKVQSPHLADDEAAQRRVAGVEEPVVRLKVLKGQVVNCVAAAVIGIPWIRSGQQRVDRGPVGVKLVDAVLPKLSLSNGLHNPVHLNQVPGPVHLRQGYPVQQAGSGPEPVLSGAGIRPHQVDRRYQTRLAGKARLRWAPERRTRTG